MATRSGDLDPGVLLYLLRVKKMNADSLVFSGGIGEHSAPVRSSVCNGLGFLGVSLDGAANQSNSSTLSTKGEARSAPASSQAKKISKLPATLALCYTGCKRRMLTCSTISATR